MEFSEIKKRAHGNLHYLLKNLGVNEAKMDPWEFSRLDQIELSLSELIERVLEFQKANESEQKQQLGEIFTVCLEKTDQTSWVFEKFYGTIIEKKRYDAIQFKDFFSLSKRKLDGKPLEEIMASVSLYIKHYGENAIKTSLTMTQIKNHFCDVLFYASAEEESILLRQIMIPFLNDSYDADGDMFFERPLAFKAQNDKGKTSTYYIVGVNYSIKE